LNPISSRRGCQGTVDSRREANCGLEVISAKGREKLDDTQIVKWVGCQRVMKLIYKRLKVGTKSTE